MRVTLFELFQFPALMEEASDAQLGALAAVVDALAGQAIHSDYPAPIAKSLLRARDRAIEHLASRRNQELSTRQ